MRLVGLAAAIAVACGASASAQNAPLTLQPGETLLEVQARGAHLARPDVMTITAGVVTTGATAGEALAANSATAERIIAALREQGIAPRDVRTAELRVQPRFDRRDETAAEEEDRSPRIIGYVARNNVELRLRDLRRASAVLDAMFRAGANNVEGPSFSLSDDLPARREARNAAVRLARQEADGYAAALGMRVVRILRVSERSRYTETAEAIVVTGSLVRGAPIEPGEIETQVTVWADFALAPQ